LEVLKDDCYYRLFKNIYIYPFGLVVLVYPESVLTSQVVLEPLLRMGGENDPSPR
jgi:hypothetical protein